MPQADDTAPLGRYSDRVDLDAYVAAHQAEWRELEWLVASRELTAGQADRMIDLYQRVGTHLSVLRSSAPDPMLVEGLSVLLGRARRRMAGTRTPTFRHFTHFFTDSFPAALYRLRWWWIITGVVCLLTALGLGWYLVANPGLEAQIGTPDEVAELVNVDFEHYYSSSPATSFALRVWTNNAWVSAQCIAFGILGFPVIQVLWANMVNLGLLGGLMTNHGRADLFFGLILPHGLLELTAVFVAGGAGLRLFWSWVVPGPRTRTASMAREGRTTVGIALGLIVVLLVSGVIEAFVTPSGLPTWARIAIGVLAWLTFLGYALVMGRAAASRGQDGDVAAAEREEDVLAVD